MTPNKNAYNHPGIAQTLAYETAEMFHDESIEDRGAHDEFTQAYVRFMDNEPKPIPLFVPANAAEQKQLFLSGQIDAPDHQYARLDTLDFEVAQQNLAMEGESILRTLDTDTKHYDAYAGVIEDYRKKTAFLQAAHDYKHALSPEDRDEARQRYMAWNIELYGAPEETVYRALLGEKLANIANKQFVGRAAELRDELSQLLPVADTAETAGYFTPSQETVDWAHEVTNALYGLMLDRVPKQEVFTASEVRTVFADILHEEFGASADGWQVVLGEAKSINVRTPDKEIIIPADRKPMSYSQLRKLVGHELGVHVLRSITGESTDVTPLRYGTAEYYDADEGLGVVVEQALEGKYRTAGVPYYILAGAAYHEGKSFRDLFEMQWRLSALETLQTEDITEEQIETKRSAAYGSVMRIMRGTDELPWFKDLAYFNGANDMWKHLEEIRGDTEQFMYVLAGGKINPLSHKERQFAYEAKTA